MSKCKSVRSMMAAAGKSPLSKQATLWQRQKGNCWLCGGGMSPPGSGGSYEATLDHVVPRSHGGGNKITNLKLAHKKCNNSRGNMSPQEFRSLGGAKDCTPQGAIMTATDPNPDRADEPPCGDCSRAPHCPTLAAITARVAALEARVPEPDGR